MVMSPIGRFGGRHRIFVGGLFRGKGMETLLGTEKLLNPKKSVDDGEEGNHRVVPHDLEEEKPRSFLLVFFANTGLLGKDSV